MIQLIFKVKKARERGRSPVEIVLKKPVASAKRKQAGPSKCEAFVELTARDSDQILSMLDKLLKKNKIKVESLKSIKLEIDKEAGLTSQRIVKAIIKALRLNL